MRVWCVTAAVAAGTGWGCGRTVPAAFLILLLAGGAVATARGTRPSTATGVMVCSFAVATLGASLRCDQPSALSELSKNVPTCELRGAVLEHSGGLGTLVSADLLDCGGSPTLEDMGPVIMEGTVGHPGGTVVARGLLAPLRDDPFDMARRRLGARTVLHARTISTALPSRGPHLVAARVRVGLTRSTDRLEESAGALLRCLTIGDTSDLDERLLELFRRAGLSHLLAVSGSNVAVVLVTVGFLLRRFALFARLLLAAGALCLFVLIVGPEPSVLRAATMGGIGLAALAWGERPEPLHALGLALGVLFLIRPGLLYSVGLHLSAAATAGIVLWADPLARRLRVLPRPLALALGATLAAQFAVAPIVLGVFGEASVAAPLANLLAFPAVPPATVLGLAAGAAGAFSAPVGAAFALIAAPFVRWILVVGETLGEPQWASIEVDRAWGWGAGAVVLVVVVRTLARRNQRPAPALGGVVTPPGSLPR
jgi:competence protein ComEC